MKNATLSKRYADAFLDTARGSIGFKRGLDELLAMKRAFSENPEAAELLLSPQVTAGEKSAFIDEAFKASFSDQTRLFLKFLLLKKRLGIFQDIAEYARIAYSHGEEVDAVLKTSYPLDTQEIEAIKSEMERRFGKKLHLYIELDSDLLGGISVKVENTIMDGSVRRRLDDLKDKLYAVRVP